MTEAADNDKVHMSRKAFEEIMEAKEHLDTLMESVELINDEEFMEGYRQAKEDIKEGRFEDWDKLKSGD
ncbi:MAG: hypothetical protein V3R82_05825 [Candidatus Hydrothermarchaeales archaeon]